MASNAAAARGVKRQSNWLMQLDAALQRVKGGVALGSATASLASVHGRRCLALEAAGFASSEAESLEAKRTALNRLEVELLGRLEGCSRAAPAASLEGLLTTAEDAYADAQQKLEHLVEAALATEKESRSKLEPLTSRLEKAKRRKAAAKQRQETVAKEFAEHLRAKERLAVAAQLLEKEAKSAADRRSAAEAAAAARLEAKARLEKRVAELQQQAKAERNSASGGTPAAAAETHAMLQRRHEELQASLAGPSPLEEAPRSPFHRARAKLIVISSSRALAGEYRMMSEALLDRPVYALHSSPANEMVYLFWSSFAGRGHWFFSSAPPARLEEAVREYLARNRQAAWAALPEELLSHWEASDGTVIDLQVLRA